MKPKTSMKGREQIKLRMASLFEAGLFKKLEMEAFKEYKEKFLSRDPLVMKKKSSMSLNVEDIQGTLALLIIGYILALTTFIGEKLC